MRRFGKVRGLWVDWKWSALVLLSLALWGWAMSPLVAATPAWRRERQGVITAGVSLLLTLVLILVTWR